MLQHPLEQQIFHKMSTETQMQFNPPRIPDVPVAPPPQTVFGTLESSGLPFSEGSQISDIPPDFSWMSEIQTFYGDFEIKSTTPLQSPIITFSVTGNKLNSSSQPVDTSSPYGVVQTWQSVPFLCSKWWSGEVGFRFIALKPPRTPGKLLFRYSFAPNMDGKDQDLFVNDSAIRGVAKEWDLSQSNIFEFDVTGLNPIDARPTWLPDFSYNFSNANTTGHVALPVMNPSTYLLGNIQVSLVIPYQPGSLYPDNIRILVFRTFKNAQFYIPTDPRHFAKNSYFQSRVNPPLQMPYLGKTAPNPT